MAGLIASLMPLLAGDAALTTAGAKKAHDNVKEKEGIKVLDDGVLGDGKIEKSESKSKSKTPNPKNLSKGELDDFMTALVGSGLSSAELNHILKTGVIGGKDLLTLGPDGLKEIEAFYDGPIGDDIKVLPFPTVGGKKKDTVLPEEKEKSKTTSISKTGSKNKTTSIKKDEGTNHTTEFPIPEEDLNELIEFVKKNYDTKYHNGYSMSPGGSDGTKPEMSPSELFDALYNNSKGKEWFKQAKKDHPEATDFQIMSDVLGQLMNNIAYNAEQQKYESEYKGYQNPYAREDAANRASRMAEKEDEALKESGLNKYVRRK